MPTISVIVPVYNTESYLRRCVDSLLAQTYRDFEVILIDDGSTDGSGEICDGYEAKDDRIHTIHQSNKGVAAARNAGLDWVFANSESKWLSFVDSDDWVHPQMYEILLENTQKRNAQISVCGCQTVNAYFEPKKIIHTEDSVEWNGAEFLRFYLTNNEGKKPWVLWDKLYRRSCFSSQRFPEGRIHEDNAVTYKLLYHSDLVVDSDLPLYYYYENPESITHKETEEGKQDWLLALREMIAFFSGSRDDVLFDKVNRIYLKELFKAYNRADSRELKRRRKKELKQQFLREKKRYTISIRTDPDLYAVLYPCYSRLYWDLWGVLSKTKGR